MSSPRLSDTDRTPPPAEREAAVRRLVEEMRGRRLPGEREMAAQLGMSRPQLRVVLAALRREGLVEQRQGSGTFALDLRDDRQRLQRVTLKLDAALKLGDDPFFTHLMERLLAALQAEGASCVIDRIGAGQEALPGAGETDGVITLGLIGAELLARHRPDDPPLVALLLGPEVQAGRTASVFQLEDREAGREAARRLVTAGCANLLFAGWDGLPASHERHIGAGEVAKAAGIPLRFMTCGLNYADGLQLGRALGHSPEGVPPGLIATNDWQAVGIRAGLSERGGFPSVRIVSFDGLPITADPTLAIESLAVPVEDIARDAVAELRRLVRPGAPLGRTLRYSLL